jgi:hypothetical protein
VIAPTKAICREAVVNRGMGCTFLFGRILGLLALGDRFGNYPDGRVSMVAIL